MATICTKLCFTVVLVYLCTINATNSQDVYACNSTIYCQGEILDYVQRAKLFKDGKTFVDMNLKEDPGNVINAFQDVLHQTSRKPNRSQLQVFVDRYFEGPGTEFEQWIPEDYKRLPSIINRIKDPLLRDLGWNLCRTWKDLGRKIKDAVREKQERYSLLYLPKPFIVPGGRFRETYYWDSYWVVRGLLLCEMHDTVKGMLENFAYLIERLGFIPNGARNYYTRRSQPPFFIPMVYEYYKATNDTDFVRNISSAMEREYQFWTTQRNISISKNGETFEMNRYASSVNKPRPESYKEDVETVEGYLHDSSELFRHLTSACESGWDFSSRWFSREDKSLNLNTTITREIIPVDLNSILCYNEKLLSRFFKTLGETLKSSEYERRSRDRQRAIDTLLWNSEKGIWQDYSMFTNSSRDYFFPSSLFPLFTDCAVDKARKTEQVLKYLEAMDILNYDGGIPTSLLASNQQWDFPNGWPPLQHTFIFALDNSGSTKAKSIAQALAQKWIENNWKGWNRTRNMFEKYSVVKPGSRGGGGEYDVQEGFGWTNGVVLDLLDKYGETLTAYPEVSTTQAPCETSSCSTLYGISLILYNLILIAVLMQTYTS